MVDRQGYYILLKDVQNPECCDNNSWWGVFTSYVSYSSEDDSEGTLMQKELALKGEILKALDEEKQPEDRKRIVLHGVKQRFLQFECDLEDVRQISETDAQLLIAVPSYSERNRIFNVGHLSRDICDGTEVKVRVKDLQRDVAGVVRYKGIVPPYEGIMFGIEILDPRYRRSGFCDGTIQCERYFRCAQRSGLFVSIDKLHLKCEHDSTSDVSQVNKSMTDRDAADNVAADVAADNVADDVANNVADNVANNVADNVANDIAHNVANDVANNVADNVTNDVADNDRNNERQGRRMENEHNVECKVAADLLEREDETSKLASHKEEKPSNKDATVGNSQLDDKKGIDAEMSKGDFEIEYLKKQLLEKENNQKCEVLIWEEKLKHERSENLRLEEEVASLRETVKRENGIVKDFEARLEQEQKNWKTQRKAFYHEWEEFERRLLEERAEKTRIEEQLAGVQRELETETNAKLAIQDELERLQLNTRERERELQRQNDFLEWRMRELESSPRADHVNGPEEHAQSGPCDWIISRDEITLTEKRLGAGGWGEVFEGKFRACDVAVKQIHELILSPHNRRLFEREMNMASRCRHPCLLQFIGATNDNGTPLFVTELLDANLRAVLESRALTETELITISVDVAKALNYLHLNKPLPIIHRDISSANVLLWRRDDCWRAKVSDYGAANFMRQCKTINPGAVIYSAPEAFSAEQTPKIDVYSFGLLLCEMYIRELPVPDQIPNQVAMVTNHALRDLITRCIRRDHGKRPTMEEVINEIIKL